MGGCYREFIDKPFLDKPFLDKPFFSLTILYKMYQSVCDPKTNNYESIFSNQGKLIIKKYIENYLKKREMCAFCNKPIQTGGDCPDTCQGFCLGPVCIGGTRDRSLLQDVCVIS